MTSTLDAPATAPARTVPWWREAVTYQVYIRSFADGDGDGTGDIAGLRSRLPYLAGLGVDALWINPWYPSPMADSGYDVADYRAVEPVFGDLDQAQALLDEAHAHRLRVLLDIVPNHSSDRHVWFQQALAAAPGSPERARYIFRDGRGPRGDEPPNDWMSRFGGPAWTRVPDGQWYLHLFAPAQPDFDWTNPEVQADFERTLRFWFDRGVDGFRIDVAHGLAKEPGLPDVGTGDEDWETSGENADAQHPFWDVEAVHEIYRDWRRIADSYAEPRVFVAEAWVPSPARLARYVRPDELHTAFNFDFLLAPWLAASMRATIDRTIASHRSVGAPTTWVLSNHDVLREVSRYARPQGTVIRHVDDVRGLPSDLRLGRRRARAAALLMLALPGGAYVYQGEELGLAEVEDIPDDRRQDPTFFQTHGRLHGRDGCRVPLPWSGTAPPYGFGPDPQERTWLPQPADWAPFTVSAEQAEPGSMLNLYRDALALRHELEALGEGGMRWVEVGPGALCFERDPGFGCLVVFDAASVALPDGAQVLLASGPVAASVPTDTAVWYRR